MCALETLLEAHMTWIIGFSVSVVVGLVVVWVIHDLTHKHLDVPESQGGIPPWLLGVCERAFFTLIVAFTVSGAAISMIAWVGIKMATGWNRLGEATGGNGDLRTRQSLGALFVDLWSIGFALVGGLICKGDIPITWFTEYVAWLGGGSGH